MAANGISTLATKELRQKAKLDLAAAKRNENYDIAKLPTQYDDNAVVDNANTGGLEPRRPWVLNYRIVTRNLQLYLDAADTDSYPGTGTTWTDLSDNGYATTLVDAPAFNTTHFAFDGVNDYVDTNQSLAAESFSLGVWFRTEASGINMMLSKEEAAGRPWNYRLWLNGGQLRADIALAASGADNLQELVFNGGHNNGEWYFVMLTRNNDEWYLYVNGAEVATRTDTFTDTVSNSQELWIGRSAFTASETNPTGSYPYDGDIGQVFVYDAVLTPAEVLQNYNATRSVYGL